MAIFTNLQRNSCWLEYMYPFPAMVYLTTVLFKDVMYVYLSDKLDKLQHTVWQL
jgi:hypothetical protein